LVIFPQWVWYGLTRRFYLTCVRRQEFLWTIVVLCWGVNPIRHGRKRFESQKREVYNEQPDTKEAIPTSGKTERLLTRRKQRQQRRIILQKERRERRWEFWPRIALIFAKRHSVSRSGLYGRRRAITVAGKSVQNRYEIGPWQVDENTQVKISQNWSKCRGGVQRKTNPDGSGRCFAPEKRKRKIGGRGAERLMGTRWSVDNKQRSWFGWVRLTAVEPRWVRNGSVLLRRPPGRQPPSSKAQKHYGGQEAIEAGKAWTMNFWFESLW